MTTEQVGLILGLAVVVAISVVLLQAQSRRTGTTTAKFSVAQLITAEVVVGPTERQAVKEAVREAAAARGQPNDQLPEEQTNGTDTFRFARVLWVDDNPDNNLFETFALEQLGLFVMKATSTEGGEFYLRRLEFAVVITDAGRGHDPNAGRALIEKVNVIRPGLATIVYTVQAYQKRPSLEAVGARAVVDTPGELVAAVQSIRPRGTTG